MPDLFTVFNYAATPGGSLVKLCFEFGATTFITFVILQKKIRRERSRIRKPKSGKFDGITVLTALLEHSGRFLGKGTM